MRKTRTKRVWLKDVGFLHKGKNLLRNNRRELIVFISALPISVLLGSVDIVRKVETKALDIQMYVMDAPPDSDVAIVRITDKDYKELFRGKSPLDPTNLQAIIEAIAAGRPKIIGVDLDTSAPEFRDFKVTTGTLPVVWARSGAYSNRTQSYHLFDVLGGRGLPPTCGSGVILMKLDSDGAIRRYTRLCDTSEGPTPSFPWELVKRLSDPSIISAREHKDELLIEFKGDPESSHRFSLAASDVLAQAKGDGWPSNGPLTNKIVLLGGDYEVQDEHKTPVGWMLGVEVLAEIVETELKGGGSTPPGVVLLTLLAFFEALILWILFQNLRMKVALILSALAVPLLSLFCSYLAFRSVERWAHFAFILLIILIYQLYERVKKEHFKNPGESMV